MAQIIAIYVLEYSQLLISLSVSNYSPLFYTLSRFEPWTVSASPRVAL